MVVTNPRNAPFRCDVFTAAPNVLKEGDAVCFVNECAFSLSTFIFSFFRTTVLSSLGSSWDHFLNQLHSLVRAALGANLPSPCQNFFPHLIFLSSTHLLEEMFPCWLILYLRVDFIPAASLLSVPRNLSAEGECNQTQC